MRYFDVTVELARSVTSSSSIALPRLVTTFWILSKLPLTNASFPVLTNGAFGAEYKDIFAFSVLIMILIFRPKGLLGEVVRERT